MVVSALPIQDSVNVARGFMKLPADPLLEASESGDEAAPPPSKKPKTMHVVQRAMLDAPVAVVPPQVVFQRQSNIFEKGILFVHTCTSFRMQCMCDSVLQV